MSCFWRGFWMLFSRHFVIEHVGCGVVSGGGNLKCRLICYTININSYFITNIHIKLGQIFFEKNCILRKCSDCIKDVKSTRFFGKCSSIPRKIHLKICSNLVNCARHCSISSLVQVFVQLVCTVMIYIHCQQYRKSSQPARQTL